ncbi:MAG: CdaR family protein [Thermoanaerobacteraceae bacterium]|nr:CdaR family protein [Thermoanaerobacteraceae bacterium]
MMSRDLPLKLFCVLVAFILWLYVIGEENPQITYNFNNIPVQLSNEDLLVRSDLILEDLKQDEVNIKVKGRRNDILKLNSSKIKAAVDLRGINGPGSTTLPVQVTGLPANIELASVTPQMITVNIDRLVSRSFDVELIPDGTLREGFVLQEYNVNPSKVTVKGPEKLMNTVRRAVVDVNIDKMDKNFSGRFEVKLLDPSNKHVNGLTIAPQEAFVTLDVSFAKDVLVKLVTTGELPEGYRLFNADVVPTTVTIMGDKETIEKINEINTKPVDMSGLKNKVSYNLQLDLPPGVAIKDNLNEVKVNLDIDRVAEKELEVDNISVVGQDPQKLDYNFTTAKVVVEGRADVVEKLSKDDIFLKATVSPEPGSYDVEIFGSLKPGIEDVTIKSVEPSTVKIQVLR